MNKIYKIVWNAARGCYVVASEMAKRHQGKKSLRASVLAAFAMAAAGGGMAYADVTVADQAKYGGTVKVSDIDGGKKYEIFNQQVSNDGDKALNRFDKFSLNQADVANLNLGTVNHQINVVNNKIDIQGVVNALKEGKIGGDVYFFSDKGIAVGATGVINVGRLTLGTNANFATSYYEGSGYNPVLGALLGAGSASISIDGTIHAAQGISIAAQDINIGSTALLQSGAVFKDPSKLTTVDAYRNNLVNTAGIQRAKDATVTSDGVLLFAINDIKMTGGTIESHGRDITMSAHNDLTISQVDAAAKGAEILSDGGKIKISDTTVSADRQAKPNEPEKGGMLVIKAANISSKTADGAGGDIEVTSTRTAMGVARVSIDDSTIDAGNTGDVTIHATANTKLYAWDIGDGAYAQIWMGKNNGEEIGGSKKTTRNTIIGKNVDIAASASTTGQVGEASETDQKQGIPDEAVKDKIWGKIKDFFTDTVANIRVIGSVTKITASADVDIAKTDIDALGTGDKAGDIRILSDARSAIQPITAGFLGFGFNVGIGNVKSNVNVDDSHFYAKKDVSIDASGDNKVALKMSEFNLVDILGTSINFSWAEAHSNVAAHVGKDAVISSEGNTDITATSTRELASTVSNGGETLSIAAAVGIADTHATAEMDGTVYAKGDVSVKAENTLAKDGNLYSPDTVGADVMSGDSANQKLIDFGKEKAGNIWTAIKTAFADDSKDESTPGGTTGDTTGDTTSGTQPSSKSTWNDLGLTASTALLFSKNDATASVNGTVRGLSSGDNGKMAGDASVGAKSLSVSAETIARTSNVTTSAVGTKTGDDGETQKKETTASAAVAYSKQRNKAEAFISGDVKTRGDVSVKADMKIPYQNVWTKGSTSDKVLEGLQDVFLSTNDLGLTNLVDSWTQTQGVAKDASGAASISVVDYDNQAKAYIGKKDKDQETTPKVDAGEKVDVNAKTDITTVNFAGSVADFFGENAANIFVSKEKAEFLKNLFNDDGWTMAKAAKTGLGGAALAVRQKNTTEAYIDDGAVVEAKSDVTLDAKTKATNIAISTAGGLAKSVAIDATVGVNRIDDGTKAYIGKATVTSGKNTSVTATDDAMNINLAGGFGISGSTGIGASVAYNHIMRKTEAWVDGTVKAGGNVKVNAKNEGEIIAASLAGAVAYDQPNSSDTNGGGSSGFHAEEMPGTSGGSGTSTPGSSSGDSSSTSETDGTLEGLVNALAGETTNILSSSNDDISRVASQDRSMDDSTGKTKNGAAVAANLSVNRIGDTASAHVGEKDEDAACAAVTAGALSVASANDSAIKAVTGAVSLNLSKKQEKGASIAGAFMYNSITGKNEAYVEKADLTLTGNKEKTKDGKDIDESLTVSADNKEKILNISVSGSGAARGTAVAGQISLNWVDDTTDAHVKDSTVQADKAVTVSAKDDGKIDSYTGAVAFSGGGEGTAVGASAAVNLIQGDTDANMESSTVTGTGADSTQGGDVKVSAEETSHITAIVASGAAADGFGAAFSGTGNWISTNTNAHVDNKAMNVKQLTVDAGNHGSATLGVGNAAIGNNAAGASIAVMVNESKVKSYAQSTNAKAEALTITADNAYNGSASDEASDSKAKTVAVGFAGGGSQFAGSGSVTVNVISQTTDAYLGKGIYDIKNGDVTIGAKSTAKLFGLAGGVSLSLGSGIGAAVDVQKYTGHTFGYIGDAATLKNAGKVDVSAVSTENLTSVAATLAGGMEFGGAGAAGAHDISTNTKAFIGKEEGTSSTAVEAAKDISVTAKDTTTLTTAAGAGGAGGTAGVGLTAAVEVVDKKVAAFVGDGVTVTAGAADAADDDKKDSLTVKATNESQSKTIANGLGAGGTAGVAGAASETFVTHTTDAYVGKSAKVTAAQGASISAASDFTQTAEAAAAGVAGTAGVGLGNSTVSFTGNTNAYTDTGATIDGGTKVEVDASNTTNVTYATVAGGVSGTAGVNGTVGVNVLTTVTKAYIGAGGSVSANKAAEKSEGISVTAKDDTTLKGGNGGLAIGAGGAGAGAAVGVTNIHKDTEVFVGGSAVLETTGKTTVKAENKETLTNYTIQGSGGLYAGLAGAVNVMNLDAITKAYTGDNVAFNQVHKANDQVTGDVTVEAAHTIDKMTSVVAGAAAGAGSLGAAVDVGVVSTQTNAYLGNNNKVYTDGAFAVTAQDHMEGISTKAIAASVGGVGLSGSISVYNFGSTQSETDLLTGKTSAGSDKTTPMDEWASQEINKSGTNKAFSAYYPNKNNEENKDNKENKDEKNAMKNIKGKVATTFKSETPNMKYKGTLAMVGDGTEVDAKSVNISADDKLSVTNITANATAGVAAAGASVSVVHTDTLTQAKTGEKSVISALDKVEVSASSDHQMKSTIVGASIAGGISIQGTEETWNDNSNVRAIVGKNSRITAAGNVDVTSYNTRGFESTLTGASVALSGAVNGALITSHVTGSSEATVDEEAKVEAGGNLVVEADADTNLSAKATGAAVGTYAGTGTGVVFDSGVTAQASVQKGAVLSADQALAIIATNTPILNAKATSVGVGLAGVGITKSYVESEDKSLVTVGDGASLSAKGSVSVNANMDTPMKDKGDYNVYADAAAGAGGVLSGAVALSEVKMDQTTKVEIGSATIKAKDLDLIANHQDAVNVKINSVGAGGVSGTGGETKTNITSAVSVNVGAATITTDGETLIAAENKTDREDKSGGKIADSIGASLAGGNGVVNSTTIKHTTTVEVGQATIKANASDLSAEEIAAGKTLYDKNAIAIEAHSNIISKDTSRLATGAAVGAAHVKNTHTATAETKTTVGQATLLAGDTNAAKEDHEKTYSGSESQVYNGSYKGGSISVGSRNDATVESKTLVDVYGLGGYAGSENDVNYEGSATTNFNATAETAKGDISAVAGRDSDGEKGTISVTAHSDILNATAIPISIKKDPVATAKNTAALNVQKEADIKSDRDIHLKANAGSVTALGTGEVKDWVNKVADAFGAEGSSLGKKSISTSANVVMDGKADTGIHRQKSITIAGAPDGNNPTQWNTVVKSDGDISYTYGSFTVVGADLFTRLNDLRQKLVDFGGDEATKAAYEAEIQFLEEKMAAQGLGYFLKNGDNTYFVELPLSSESELKEAKEILEMADKVAEDSIIESYKGTQQKQLSELGNLAGKYKEAQTAAAAASEKVKESAAALQTAGEAKDSAEKTVNALAEAANQSLEDYVEANSTATEVMTYKEACDTYKNKEGANKEAVDAAAKAQEAVVTSKDAYVTAVNDYNTAYDDKISTKPEDYNKADMDALNNAIDKAAEEAKSQAAENRLALEAQIKATEKFFSTGGTEENGKFYKGEDEIVAVYSDGSAAGLGADGSPLADDDKGYGYYLLHSKPYNQVTHDVQIGDITAQLGDILFEGDNVSGSGTLKAGGDASVTITNASPDNLTVGDVKVVGRLGTDGAGQGGTIYYNDAELKGNMADAIAKANKDKTKEVSFTITTRNDTNAAEPTITIENTFRPSSYTRTEDGETTNIPLFAASTTNLTGYIYNPRGAVKVSSEDGDLFSDGTIYAGTVDMKINNGDFIQSYNSKSNSIYSVGGAPLDDKGKLSSGTGTGILANGNVFISARYVNINSTIQSGIDNWDITIPENYTLYYEDKDVGKVYVTKDSTIPSGCTVRVEGATGQGADKLSYDFENDRFVVDDIEVHGGKVSIVGTIINTTNNTSKAAIKALDGYGQIVINNNSDKDIELRTLSTGEGTEGKIEITDLDRTSGKILSKTTYTRDGGQIKQSVQSYSDGEPLGDEKVTAYEKDTSAVYKPLSGSYYTLQTGTDYSYTATYKLKTTRLDWFGTKNKAPTGAEMLKQGGEVTDTKTGDTRTLNGGAIITSTDRLAGSKDASTKDGVQYSKKDVFDARKTVSFDQKEKRLWLTLGMAKKYDYTLVEKEYQTNLEQYSVLADYGIGIDFMGNENGGTLAVNGGTGNVIVGGTWSNGTGTASISGGSITQGARGYIDAGELTMTATTGSAGTAGAAIKTSAYTVSGTAAKDFAVNVVNHGVTVGAITSGGTVSLTADDTISQKAGSLVTANRVELNSDAAITGESGSFQVKTAAQEGKDYGLKANAAGNISITNTGGDLYLDSVISKNGTVTLTTDGSFVDNNYTDYDNETAQAKLLAWGNAAVLEGSGETMSKQKDRLIAKVESKYNEFQSLKAYVNSEGVYTLDEATRKTIASQGLDVDAYIAEKQARYDALKDSVGKWTADEVKSYVESVRSDKSDIFNNASVTKEMIDGDDFLTRDEKAEVLVGSAKSAKDLLVTFTSGGIKEGITDTNTSHKGTPHVSGTRVTLTTTGGNIGQKKEDMEIDLSDPSKLTRDQLLALASAEKSDFQALENNIVKVSSVRPIDAESTGVLNATAAQGSIYLVTEGALASGSSLTAGEGVRIKGAGPIKGLTVSAGKEIVLESAGDAITGTTITGSGVLTARAKNGVDIKKSDGDLVVNTIYAAEGDVTIDLAGENGNDNSLLAEERDEKESDTYVNIEGQNITVKNVKDMKGQNSSTTTLGLQATGKTDSTTGDVIGGTITANAGGNANISLFGNSSSDKTAIEAENLTLTNTNKSFIGSGHYKARAELKVNNQGTITGGTFEGAKTTLTNSGVVNKTTETSAPAFKATKTLTVDNHQDLVNGTYETDGGLVINNHTDGTIEGGIFSAGTLALTNESTVKDGSYTAVSSLTVENKENASIEGGDYKSTEGSVEISGGTIKNGTYTAKTDLTYTDGKSIEGATFTAQEGKMDVTSSGKIHLAEAKAHSNLTVTAAGNENITIDKGESETGDAVITAAKGVTITESLKSAKDTTVKADGGDLTAKLIDAGETADLYASGKVNVTTLKAGTFATATSVGNMIITDGTAEKNLTLTSTDGNIEVGSLTSAKGTTKLIAEKGTVKAETLTAGSNVEAKSGGDMTIANGTAANSIIMESTAGNMTSTTLTATKGNAKLIAGGTMEVNALTAGTHVVAASGGDMNITNGTAAKNLTLTSTAGNIEGTALEATTGKASLDAAKGVTISESLKSKTDSTVKTNGGDLNAKLIDAGKKADLYASGAMNVTTLKAGTDAVAKSSGDMTITTGTAANNLTMESTAGNITATTLTADKGYAKLTAHGTMDVGTVTAGDQVTAKSGGDMNITNATAAQTLNLTSTDGNITGTNLTATKGNAVLNAKGTMDVGTLTAGTNVSATSGGDMTITTAAAENKLTLKSTGGNLKGTTLSAKGNAEITAHGIMDVTTLTAGNHATATSGGDMTITNATAAKNLTLTSTDGSVTGTTFKATAGTARVTADNGVTISESLQSGASSIVKANGGDLTAKLIDAGETADLYAKGAMNVTTLKAGKNAKAEAEGNISITTGTAGNDLIITSTNGDVEGTTLTATKGTATLNADGTMNVTTLNAGQDIAATSGGDMTITTGTAANNLAMESTGGNITGTTLTATNGNADITAGQSISISELAAGQHTTVKARGGTLTADSIAANANADLYSHGLMDIENLTAQNGTLISDDSMDVTNAKIGDTLSMTAKKDIIVSQSDSVNKTIMNAGGSIQTKGENANISSDVIEMTAGENILVTDRSPVEKLTGVDTSEAAAVTTGSGKAGSLLYGEAAGYSYDVSKKGTATLTARKGTAALTAKKVEADTAVIGTEGTASPAALNITADNVGIDDLQSAADALHVMIRGNTTDNTHYAGIHNSTSGSAIVKDSRIDHLNFTGANDIGVENTTFAGDSILQTEKVLFRLWKNPGNNTAESIGKLFIHDYDIASSEYFSRICNGLMINGERFPYTADSVMNKSLFGDNYLGRDGRETEEENTFYAKELSFGEVTESEAYRVVK